jgi:hypothetical protein
MFDLCYIEELYMAGKGSKARPLSVPREKFADNWDKIFNKPKEEPKHDNNEKRQN